MKKIIRYHYLRDPFQWPNTFIWSTQAKHRSTHPWIVLADTKAHTINEERRFKLLHRFIKQYVMVRIICNSFHTRGQRCTSKKVIVLGVCTCVDYTPDEHPTKRYTHVGTGDAPLGTTTTRQRWYLGPTRESREPSTTDIYESRRLARHGVMRRATSKTTATLNKMI